MRSKRTEDEPKHHSYRRKKRLIITVTCTVRMGLNTSFISLLLVQEAVVT